MKSLVLLLVSLPFLFALAPAVKNALRDKVVIDFKNALVPIISKEVAHIPLPDTHSKHDGVHIDVTNVEIDVNPFHPNQININFVPNTGIVRFGASDLSMKGLAKIHAKWLFVHYSFEAKVEVRKLGFECETAFLSHNAKPNIKVNNLVIQLSKSDVKITFHGGILAKILEFLTRLLEGHFIDNIKKTLDAKLPPAITTAVNAKLDSLPSDLPIGHDLAVKYSFPDSPIVKNGYMHTDITMYVHPKSSGALPPFPVPSVPDFEPDHPHGVQFFMADYVIKSEIWAAYTAGLYKLTVDKDMLGHHLHMECAAPKMPQFAFNNSINVLTEDACTVIVDHNPDAHFTLNTQLHVNLKERVNEAVLYFSITEVKILKLDFAFGPIPIDIEWFKNGINAVMAVVVELVNKMIGEAGIPLPKIKDIDYTDTVQYIKNGYMELGMNPIFKF